MSYLLVYKDPYNGRLKALDVPLPDVSSGRVRATIAEFKKLYAFMLPPEKEGVHYMLLQKIEEEAPNDCNGGETVGEAS